MAIYRLEAKIIGREKRGRSVVAAAAYRAGEKLHGDREAKTHDYARRSKGVLATTILTPEGAPSWTADSGVLWNTVEAGEKRVDAQLAREFILSLPNELPSDEQFDLAVDWSRETLVKSGMVVQVSLHHSKDGKNPHAHVLCTMRRLDGDRFAAKKATDWNDKTLLLSQRESWAHAVNEALEKAGSDARVDHRSLKKQGIDRIPEPKIGIAATAMQKRGAVADPKRFQDLRFVKLLNDIMPNIRAVQRSGQPAQDSGRSSWWEKSVGFFTRAKEAARERAMDTWRTLVEPWKRGHHEMPAPEKRDQDISI